MALAGWLSVFSPDIRKAFPLIQRAVREGLSTQLIIDSARGSGFRFRDSNMRQVVRAVRTAQDIGRGLKSLPVTKTIPLNKHTAADTFQRREYSYKFLEQGISPITGKLESRYTTLSSDRALSPREAVEALSERDEERGRGAEYGLQDATLTLVGARRAGQDKILGLPT